MNSDVSVGGPPTQDHVIEGRDSEIIFVRGRMLGFATSQRDVHEHLADYAAPGERCSACRWFEVRIYGVDYELTGDGDDYESIERRGRYLVLTSGVSVVPDEVIMRRAVWTDSPFEVVEVLTQRRGTTPYLPAPSARVLSQAAAWDDGLSDAYINRAVV